MSPPICGDCHQILSGPYYRAGNGYLCAPCGEKRKAAGSKPSGLFGFFRRKVEVIGPLQTDHPMPPPGAGV